MDQSHTTPDRVLRWPQVQTLVGLSRTSVWRMVRNGKFPKPVAPADSRYIGWFERDISAWQRQRRTAAGLDTTEN